MHLLFLTLDTIDISFSAHFICIKSDTNKDTFDCIQIYKIDVFEEKYAYVTSNDKIALNQIQMVFIFI